MSVESSGNSDIELARMEERITAVMDAKVEEHTRMWWFLGALGSMTVAGFVTVATWVVTVEQKIASRTEVAIERLVDRLSAQDQRAMDKIEKLAEHVTDMDRQRGLDASRFEAIQKGIEMNREILNAMRNRGDKNDRDARDAR